MNYSAEIANVMKQAHSLGAEINAHVRDNGRDRKYWRSLSKHKMLEHRQCDLRRQAGNLPRSMAGAGSSVISLHARWRAVERTKENTTAAAVGEALAPMTKQSVHYLTSYSIIRCSFASPRDRIALPPSSANLTTPMLQMPAQTPLGSVL